MIIEKLIEKVEGEATLDFHFEPEGTIDDVEIRFGFYRGIEEILVEKDALDALVITPRVCGICNHAHLIAAVRAIEDAYTDAGIDVMLSQKAEKIRQFTLACELMQNHIKWLYLAIMPKLEKLNADPSQENHALKASYFASTITKALAIFAGQWPHSSYAVPGGVTCDPTHVDIIQAESLLDSAIGFVEQIVVGLPLDQYLSLGSIAGLQKIGGDLAKILEMMGRAGIAKKGKSHDRFIVFGEDFWFQRRKSMVTTVSNVDVRYVREVLQDSTQAKAVIYRERLFEVGPLARAMVTKEPIIKCLHKRYKDALVSRVFARVHEMVRLLHESKALLRELRLDEPSCTLASHQGVDHCEGIGIVEAARGPLIHRSRIEEGRIANYEIITPTQWTLSNGYKEQKGVAAKAMCGVSSTEEASFIFRTFDICSVCTTH